MILATEQTPILAEVWRTTPGLAGLKLCLAYLDLREVGFMYASRGGYD